MTINIVFPVLNENHRLKTGIEKTVQFLKTHPEIDYRITIADNGSDEAHRKIAKSIAESYDKVHHIYIPEKGVGGAFQAAVNANECDIIGYMDTDLATPPKYIPDVIEIFTNHPDVNVINASRLLKESLVKNRRLIREITSRILNNIIPFVFKTKFTDAMVSFKFFRKETVEYLSKYTDNDRSWFYCAELLIWAEKLGYKVYEIPIEWHDDPDNTKVRIWPLAKIYLRRIRHIRKRLKACSFECSKESSVEEI